MFRRVLVCVAAASFVVACESSTEVEARYGGSLSGSAERPTPVTTAATGLFSATLDGNVLSYDLSFTGLSSNALSAHIHGPATLDAAAGILVDLAATGRTLTLGGTSGTGNGTVDLSASSVVTATVSGDSLRKLLDLGLLYVNVHSQTFQGGEIRGQITRQ